jgi:dTDP-glucose 4,6-dehydratase
MAEDLAFVFGSHSVPFDRSEAIAKSRVFRMETRLSGQLKGFSMRNILITGGAGFIGQNLVHAWRALYPDDRLTVIDAVTYAANLRSLDPLIARKEIQFVKGDINEAALLRRLFEENRFSRVAHLAAESHVDRSIDDPEAFLNTNVLGTFSLLKASLDFWRASGMLDEARFLHVSTD